MNAWAFANAISDVFACATQQKTLILQPSSLLGLPDFPISQCVEL